MTEAVLLSPFLADDIEQIEFTASLLDGQSSLPVECRIATITEFAVSEDDDGNRVTLFDGERNSLSLEEQAVRNHVKLYLDTDGELVSRPSLLTTEARTRFGRQSVEVEVVPASIAELPDFRAEVVYGRWFEEMLRDPDYEPPPSSHSDEIEACASTLSLRSGMVLPVDGPDEDAEHPRALVLGSQLSPSPQRFVASLYSFYPTGAVQPGTVFSRTVRWRKDPKQRTWAGLIGHVLRTVG